MSDASPPSPAPARATRGPADHALDLVQRRPWLPTAFIGALATLAMGGAVFFRPWSAALGSAYTEALGHLWGLWCTAQGIWEHGPFVRVAQINYPEGFTSHLMDPINLAAFLPFYWATGSGAVGAALGWNALHAATTLLGAFGCWRLGQRLVGDHPAAPWAIALMASIFCLSPYLLQVPYMGRTEYLPAVLYPWHLALLHEWLRLPAGVGGEGATLAERPRLTVGVGAGLVLGAIALGGWYIAVFVFLLEAPLSLWMARRLPWREKIWRLAVVAGVGVLCALPAAIALIQHPPDGSNSFFSDGGNKPIPAFRAEEYPPVALAEMLRLSERREVEQWMDQAPYVGVFALWLGVLGAAAWRRQALGWLLLLIWALAIAPGPLLRMQSSEGTLQEVGSVRTPVYFLLQHIDGLRPLRSWSRMAVLAALPAGVVAMYGYLALAPRARLPQALAGLGLIGLTLADQTTWPKFYSFDRPSFPAAAPADLLTVLKDLTPGPVINFPIDTALRKGGGPEMHGHYLLWQLQHGRPVPTSFRGIYDTTLEHSVLTRSAALFAYANVQARGGSLDPNAALTTTAPTFSVQDVACSQIDARELYQRGFVVATLQRDLAGAAGLESFLREVLGEPVAEAPMALAWELSRVPSPDPTVDTSTCALPEIPNRLLKRGG